MATIAVEDGVVRVSTCGKKNALTGCNMIKVEVPRRARSFTRSLSRFDFEAYENLTCEVERKHAGQAIIDTPVDLVPVKNAMIEGIIVNEVSNPGSPSVILMRRTMSGDAE